MLTKEEIRGLIRDKKRTMPEAEIQDKSQRIWDKLTNTLEFRKAENIYVYVSYNQEVETKTYIEQMLKKGKKVAVPRIIAGKMKFFYIEEIQSLQKGYQGILEPPIGAKECNSSGLMLLPGLAFDKSGHRCGYGGGFYDAYLEKYDLGNIVKFALAYDYQVIGEIPTEPHDKLLDGIVTEYKIYRI